MGNPNEFSQPVSFLNGGPFETTWGPYPTKEAACLALKNEVDADGRNVRMGKIVGIGTNAKYVQHHWDGGYEDFHLVETYRDNVKLSEFKKVLGQHDILSDMLPDKYAISDPDGKKLFEVGVDGVKYIGQITQQMINAITAQIAQRLVTSDFEKYLAQYYINSDLYPDKFMVPDPRGNVLFKVDEQGVDYIGQVKKAELEAVNSSLSALASNPLFVKVLDLYPDRIIFSDPRGRKLFDMGIEGLNFIGKDSGSGLGTVVFPKPILLWDIIQIIVFGQSLSVAGSSTQSIDLYDTRTFKGGILTNYDPTIAGAADTYFGSDFINMPATGTESGKIIGKVLKELIRDENGIPINVVADPVTGLKTDISQQFTPVINAPGTGGASWSALSNTTGIYYTRLIESVRRAKDMAMSEGKTFSVPFVVWMQGESSSDKADSTQAYYAKMETLFANLNNDIKAITGESKDVNFIVYQIASFPLNAPATVNVPLAFLKIAKEKSNVFFGSAMYQETYSDALHLVSSSYRIVFARMGAIIKRALVDGVKVEPINPKSWTVSSNSTGTEWLINMKMHVPVEPLVFDAEHKAYTTPTTNAGLSILKNGTEIITGVSISRGNTLNIKCSADPKGLELTYAITGVTSGGHLRDSQGDKLKVSTQGVTQRVDNWAPIFKQTI